MAQEKIGINNNKAKEMDGLMDFLMFALPGGFIGEHLHMVCWP